MLCENGKSNGSYAIRLLDLESKWLRDCDMVEKVKVAIGLEQFWKSLPAEKRVWVSDRKPETCVKQAKCPKPKDKALLYSIKTGAKDMSTEGVYSALELEVDVLSMPVEAAVSESLPVPVLLGRVVPQLASLLVKPVGAELKSKEVMVVVTWVQAKRQLQEEILRWEQEIISGVEPKPMEQLNREDKSAEEGPQSVDNTRLVRGAKRTAGVLTKKQKRTLRQQLAQGESSTAIAVGITMEGRATVLKDVEEFVITVHIVRNKTTRKAVLVPLIPLPVVAEQLSRIPMDIICPLPRSSSGNRSAESNYSVEEGSEGYLDGSSDIPVWNEKQAVEPQLNDSKDLLKELEAAVKDLPGKTRLTEHRIETAPVVLAKKNSSLRICVDYRRINEVIQTDTYPIPHVDKIVDQLGKDMFITTLDLFKWMPFGLIGAPVTLVDQELQSYTSAYIDDLGNEGGALGTSAGGARSAKAGRTNDFSREFILQTYTSDRAVSAVLSQVNEIGKEHPVGYFRRNLLPQEECYSTIEREYLAIKMGVEEFSVYLLAAVAEQPERQQLKIDQVESDASFSVRHWSRTTNSNADALSRIPTT
eukprot:Em0001g514a